MSENNKNPGEEMPEKHRTPDVSKLLTWTAVITAITLGVFFISFERGDNTAGASLSAFIILLFIFSLAEAFHAVTGNKIFDTLPLITSSAIATLTTLTLFVGHIFIARAIISTDYISAGTFGIAVTVATGISCVKRESISIMIACAISMTEALTLWWIIFFRHLPAS